jgi:hypothetical protein
MRESSLNFGILIGFLGCLCIADHAIGQASDETQLWQAGSGEITLELRGDYLPDFGIEILDAGRAIDDRRSLSVELVAAESLAVRAPWGIFDSLTTDRGRLEAVFDLTWNRGPRTLRMERVQFRPGNRAGHPTLIAEDPEGNPLFTLSHIHLSLHPERRRMNLANAEMEASAFLAERLGLPGLAGMPIGTAWLNLALDIPASAETSGTPPSCADRPIWPQEGQYEADVTLIGMGNVAYQGTEPGTGLIKVAPSATLRNESLADVPWVGQFDTLPDYPYSPRDQHPFLVWNMYEISDGRIRMMAGSGVKHAFFSINVGAQCQNCGSGNVLWPQCEDTYSSGNNDTSTYQGPRSEIDASEGLWDNCNSFFDPDCTGSQTQYSGQWLNRLLIDPARFQQPDTRYFIDAWYVVRHDVDIWNTMGYREINPTPSGTGWLMNPSPAFNQGPTVSEWVPANPGDPMQDHDVIEVASDTPGSPYPDSMPQGHLRLLVKVTEPQPGRYRYNYALQNYDFDRALEGFQLSLPDGAEVFDIHFADVDDNDANNWEVAATNGLVEFRAPAGNALEWFTLFNFEVETDAAPVTSEVTLNVCGQDLSENLTVETLGPAPGTSLLFGDAFRGTSC